MSPEEVKALRAELRCTAHDLASALGVDAKTVFAWEAGERFPTKRHCEQMKALQNRGADAFPKRKARLAKGTAKGALRDERLLPVLRKLAAHPDLFEKVIALSEGYEDPDGD